MHKKLRQTAGANRLVSPVWICLFYFQIKDCLSGNLKSFVPLSMIVTQYIDHEHGKTHTWSSPTGFIINQIHRNYKTHTQAAQYGSWHISHTDRSSHRWKRRLWNIYVAQHGSLHTQATSDFHILSTVCSHNKLIVISLCKKAVNHAHYKHFIFMGLQHFWVRWKWKITAALGDSEESPR